MSHDRRWKRAHSISRTMFFRTSWEQLQHVYYRRSDHIVLLPLHSSHTISSKLEGWVAFMFGWSGFCSYVSDTRSRTTNSMLAVHVLYMQINHCRWSNDLLMDTQKKLLGYQVVRLVPSSHQLLLVYISMMLITIWRSRFKVHGTRPGHE